MQRSSSPFLVGTEMIAVDSVTISTQNTLLHHPCKQVVGYSKTHCSIILVRFNGVEICNKLQRTKT